MAKVLVLYYSAYGHIETMAYAVAEGAKSAGAEVTVKRVPELVPAEVAKASYFKVDQAAEIATPDELGDYDAIIFGAGTRFGTVASQMRNFVDQTGGLWMKGGLVGKVGSVFTSSATQHGGQESTILGFIPTLMHQGMVVVGLPYAFQGRWVLKKSRAVRPMAHRRSPAVTVRASHRKSNWKPRAIKAPMLPRSRPSCRPEPRKDGYVRFEGRSQGRPFSAVRHKQKGWRTRKAGRSPPQLETGRTPVFRATLRCRDAMLRSATQVLATGTSAGIGRSGLVTVDSMK